MNRNPRIVLTTGHIVPCKWSTPLPEQRKYCQDYCQIHGYFTFASDRALDYIRAHNLPNPIPADQILLIIE